MSNKFLKNVVLHIKYPYTALIISVMWIGMAVIIVNQETINNIEILVAATAVASLIIAFRGFRTPK